jgi:hypothetical protein
MRAPLSSHPHPHRLVLNPGLGCRPDMLRKDKPVLSYLFASLDPLETNDRDLGGLEQWGLGLSGTECRLLGLLQAAMQCILPYGVFCCWITRNLNFILGCWS